MTTSISDALELHRQREVEATATDILSQHSQPESKGTYEITRTRRLAYIARVLGYMRNANFARAVGESVAGQTDQEVTVWTTGSYKGDSADPENWPAKITISNFPTLPENRFRILYPTGENS